MRAEVRNVTKTILIDWLSGKQKASCDWCIISLSSGKVTHPYKSGRVGLPIESKHS